MCEVILGWQSDVVHKPDRDNTKKYLSRVIRMPNIRPLVTDFLRQSSRDRKKKKHPIYIKIDKNAKGTSEITL